MFKAIAWATDGSPSVRNAFATAKNLARVTDARLVVPPPASRSGSPPGVDDG